MVLLNTQIEQHYSSLEFRYLFDIPRCHCVFASARDKETSRAHLFLIFKSGRIYTYKGLSGTWIELETERQYTRISELVNGVLEQGSVPYFTTNKRF